MKFLKTLSHESNRNNEILKYALYFAEVHFCNSKWQEMGIMKKNLDMNGSNKLLETSNYIARKQNLW